MITSKNLIKLNSSFWEDDFEEISNLMIEFARLHVKEALKQATIKAEIKDTYNRYTVIDKDSILNAYSEDNIK